MPEITVLTAVRNGKKYLPATLASIQAQTFGDWEWILVDDASADDTPRLIEAAMRLDARIKLLRRERPGGPFIAAYDGLRYATGKYVARTDADDLSEPKRFARQRNFLQTQPELKACATFCQLCDEAGPLPYFYTAPLTSGSLKWYLALRCPLIHSSAFMERNLLQDFYAASPALKTYLQWSDDPQAEPYAVVPDVEDYRMWCAYARAGVLGVLPETMVYYRRNEHSVSRLRQAEQQQLAKEVLCEHLARLTSEPWPLADQEALYAASHAQSFSLRQGLKALQRWEEQWTHDDALTREEQAELRELTEFRRKRFVRSNVRQRPFEVLRHLSVLCRSTPRRLQER